MNEPFCAPCMLAPVVITGTSIGVYGTFVKENKSLIILTTILVTIICCILLL